MIHVFNMNHYQTTFQHFLYISMDVMLFVLKSHQCEAWPQPLHNPFTITLIYLYHISVIVSIYISIVSTQNNHRIYCFSSMRYNQTINSLKYLSSYPSVIRCAPWLPCIQCTLDDQHYLDHRRVFQLHIRWCFHWKGFLCIQRETCGSTQSMMHCCAI